MSDEFNLRPSPAVFDSLGCFVKWGSEITVEEGQCLLAIRRHFDNLVPVPEIYGWRTDGDEVFLYMEAITGKTLEQAWDTMEHEERLEICHKLRVIFDDLRKTTQEPSEAYVGKWVRKCHGRVLFLT